MAIYGPFTRTIISTSTVYQTRMSYKQTPPYLARLQYEMRHRRLLVGTGSPSGISYDALAVSPAYQPALLKAYERFRQSVHEKAELAVSVAERKQAADMIVKRLVQVTSFVRNLRKGDLVSALGALGYQPPKSERKVSNAKKKKRWDQARRESRKGQTPTPDTYTEAYDSFGGPPRKAGRQFRRKQTKTWRQRGEVAASTFLEFHFGWVPLVKDIGAAIDVLQKPFDAVVGKGRGTSTAKSGTKPNPGTFAGGSTYNWTSRVQLIADIKVTNPNLYLANQLGLVNPLAVAWETVPFSFVLDWFVNVSSFLNQWSEFIGVELQNSATTHFVTCEDSGWYGTYGQPTLIRQTLENSWKRSLGISLPALQLKPFRGLSPTRGIVAVSLLLQQLKHVK